MLSIFCFFLLICREKEREREKNFVVDFDSSFISQKSVRWRFENFFHHDETICEKKWKTRMTLCFNDWLIDCLFKFWSRKATFHLIDAFHWLYKNATKTQTYRYGLSHWKTFRRCWWENETFYWARSKTCCTTTCNTETVATTWCFDSTSTRRFLTQQKIINKLHRINLIRNDEIFNFKLMNTFNWISIKLLCCRNEKLVLFCFSLTGKRRRGKLIIERLIMKFDVDSELFSADWNRKDVSNDEKITPKIRWRFCSKNSRVSVPLRFLDDTGRNVLFNYHRRKEFRSCWTTQQTQF